MKLHGTERFRAAIAEKRALTLDAFERMSRIPGLKMVAPPQLSLFAFHLSWPGATGDEENRATQELLVRVRARRRVYLTGCWIGGRFLGRVCILSFRTRQDRVDDCIQHVAEETAALIPSSSRHASRD